MPQRQRTFGMEMIFVFLQNDFPISTAECFNPLLQVANLLHLRWDGGNNCCSVVVTLRFFGAFRRTPSLYFWGGLAIIFTSKTSVYSFLKTRRLYIVVITHRVSAIPTCLHSNQSAPHEKHALLCAKNLTSFENFCLESFCCLKPETLCLLWRGLGWPPEQSINVGVRRGMW